MSNNLKVFVLISLLTILIVGTGIFTQSFLKSTSDGLVDQIAKVESNTMSGDWTAAKNNLLPIQDKWSAVKGKWAVLVDHQEIDNIDVTLSRMQKYVQSRDMSSALAEASALLKFVRHIPNKETISLENVF